MSFHFLLGLTSVNNLSATIATQCLSNNHILTIFPNQGMTNDVRNAMVSASASVDNNEDAPGRAIEWNDGVADGVPAPAPAPVRKASVASTGAGPKSGAQSRKASVAA